MFRRSSYKKAARLHIAKVIRREKRVYSFGRCKGNWFGLRADAIAFHKAIFTLPPQSLILQLAETTRRLPTVSTKTINMSRYKVNNDNT
jgi:hypothetical protein